MCLCVREPENTFFQNYQTLKVCHIAAVWQITAPLSVDSIFPSQYEGRKWGKGADQKRIFKAADRKHVPCCLLEEPLCLWCRDVGHRWPDNGHCAQWWCILSLKPNDQRIWGFWSSVFLIRRQRVQHGGILLSCWGMVRMKAEPPSSCVFSAVPTVKRA